MKNIKYKNLPHVSILILNWNGWKDTIECLESVYQNIYPNYDVIVVDNDSEDDSIQKIKEYCRGNISIESPLFNYKTNGKPINIFEYSKEETEYQKSIENEFCNTSSDKKLVLIKNDKNYGFSEGNNIAIRFALDRLNTDYLFLLNNDTVMDQKSLLKLIEFGETRTDVGIIGSKIYNYDLEGKFNIIQSTGGNLDFWKYPGYFPINNGIKDNNKNFNSLIECEWVTGAAMMIKSVALNEELLNSDFFFGCEDVDLSIRLKKKGYKVIAVLDSKIWHKGEVSRRKKYSNLNSMNYRVKTNLKLLKQHNKNYYYCLPFYIVPIMLRYIFYIKERLNP